MWFKKKICGINSAQGWAATARHIYSRKRKIQMSIVYRGSQKAGQTSKVKYTFCKQRILEYGCAMGETVDIDIFITSRKGATY